MDAIVQFGPKRSGNHLLTNWIMSLYSGAHHFNDFQAGDNLHDDEAHKFFTACRYISEPLIIVTIEQPQKFSAGSLISFESVFRNQLFDRRCLLIHLARDPFNWLASYAINNNHAEPDKLVAITDADWHYWYASLLLWEKSSWRVNYNDFVTDEAVRRDLANRLGRSFDPVIDHAIRDHLWWPPAVYRPSSFDTDAVITNQLNASAMRVQERYLSIIPTLRAAPPPDHIWDAAARWWPKLTADVRAVLNNPA